MSTTDDRAADDYATPGSFGEAPTDYRLPGTMRLGAVYLQVADLDRSLAFYETVLGLRLIERTEARATLAAQADTEALVVLHALRDAAPMPARGRLGLYHVALLLPDRAALGRFVRHLAAIGARAGAADHLVSEALYLHDPDGLGIEVYADRPRETWQRDGRQLRMASDPLDMDALVQAAGDTMWSGMPSGSKVGHVHLHVGDLDQASAFYHAAVGFDRMVWSYRGALFLAAGGYHHHLGLNIWAGTTATPPGAGDARLLEWTLVVPDAATLATIAHRVRATGGGSVTEDAGTVLLRDPWGTAMRLTVAVDPLARAVPRAVTS